MSLVTDAKREAAHRALVSGGVPLDPYPGYLTWFVRACVERGAASGLNWMCHIFPKRETAILEHWCRLACEGRHLWAWEEARARLEDLVTRGEDIPAPLAQFAIEPPPRATPGPAPEGSRAVLTEFMVGVLQEGGLDPHEVNAQFGASFPSPGKDPGTTLRKRRAKGRPFVSPVFEPHAGAESDSLPPTRALSLEVDWSDRREASLALLTSRWPAFALLWEFWPGRRGEHLALWCERAKRDAWVWDELRALLDHAIYCGWSLPPLLRDVVALARPANPAHPPLHYGRWVRVAAIEARLAEIVRSLDAAHLLVAEAFELARCRRQRAEAHSLCSRNLAEFPDLGFDLDPSTVRKHFFSGREQLQGVSAFPQG